MRSHNEQNTCTQVSFGTIGLGVGSTLLITGFLGYFNFVQIVDNSLSALLLIYGFPITLIGAVHARAGIQPAVHVQGNAVLTLTPPRTGFALKYAELKPLECISYADAVAARDTQATPIQQQVGFLHASPSSP